MRHVAMLCLLLAAGARAPGAAAQSAAPFSEIEITAGAVVTTAGQPFSSYWAPGPGPTVRIETPFFLGHVSGSVTVTPVGAQPDAGAPSYLSVLVSGGWAASLQLPGGVRASPGIRTGLYGMRFDDPSSSFSVRHESELLAGLDLRLSVPLGAGWHVGGSLSAVRVFTHHPLDFRLFEFGVSRVVATPGWLRRVLE